MIIKKINEKLRQIPKMYYYVPPCPECGSRRTGRYLRKPYFPDAGAEKYMIRQCLENGELVKLVKWVPQKNAYCEDCGHEWEQEIHTAMVSTEKIQEEIAARGTDILLSEYNKINPKKKKTILGKVFGFFP